MRSRVCYILLGDDGCFRFAVCDFAREVGVLNRRNGSYFRQIADLQVRGSNSAVECQLPKLDVVGSIPISRSFVSIS